MEHVRPIMENIHISNQWYYILIPVVIMGFDMLTGFLNAWIKKEVMSSKLRSGITKKFGEMVMIIIALFFYYTIGLPIEIVTCITIYIVVMELISIIENLNKLGVRVPNWIKKRLNDVADESVENDVKKD